MDGSIADRIADIFIDRFGLFGDLSILCEIAEYTRRKWERLGYDETYLPILFETELQDYCTRNAINAIGRRNYERAVQRS